MTKVVSQRLTRRSHVRIEILDAIHDIMYMKLPKKLTYEQCKEAVVAALEKLLAEWQEHPDESFKKAAEYFRYWLRKIGTMLPTVM